MGDLVKLGQRAPTTHTQAYDRLELPLGTARWAGHADAGIVGYRVGNFWLGRRPDLGFAGTDDNRHVFVCANTRGGKGVSCIIPNLLTWPGSIVVIDPKGENAMITARRRAGGSRYSSGMGQSVIVLDPFDASSTPDDDRADLKSSFNPIQMLGADREQSIDLAALIADSLVDAQGGSDNFFDEASKDKIKFYALHVATSPKFKPEERTLMTVRKLIQAGDHEAHKYWVEKVGKKKAPSGHTLLFAAMEKNPSFGGIVARAGARYADLEKSSPKTLASIVQVASLHTDFLDSPAMQRVLRPSSVTLSDLKTAKKGVSLYLCLPEYHKPKHYRWLRLMTAMIMAEMQRVRETPATGKPLLLVLDEFPGLGRMKIIENAAAQIAGHGVKLMFVSQTLAQLKDIYKDNWESLLGNCGVKLFFCNDDHFTRKYVSDLMGESEVIRPTQSKNTSIARSEGASESKSDGLSTGRSLGESNGMTMGQNMSLSSGANAGMHIGSSISNGTSKSTGETLSTTWSTSHGPQKRPLANPDEVGRWFGNVATGETLCLMSGSQPVVLERLPYYAQDCFDGLHDPHYSHAAPLRLYQVKIKRQAAAGRKAARDEAERLRQAECRAQAEENNFQLSKAAFETWVETERRKEIEDERQRRTDARYVREAERREWLVGTILGSLFSGTAIFVYKCYLWFL